MKYLLIHILVLVSLQGIAQSPSRCKIYQYEDTDSTKKKLVSVENYYAQGQVTKSYINNWRENAMEEASDEYKINYYKKVELGYEFISNYSKIP